nr:immunoglobulin heavy chain junction region [Mus musculus]
CARDYRDYYFDYW